MIIAREKFYSLNVSKYHVIQVFIFTFVKRGLQTFQYTLVIKTTFSKNMTMQNSYDSVENIVDIFVLILRPFLILGRLNSNLDDFLHFCHRTIC